jgi:hypothetical protein
VTASQGKKQTLLQIDAFIAQISSIASGHVRRWLLAQQCPREKSYPNRHFQKIEDRGKDCLKKTPPLGYKMEINMGCSHFEYCTQ